MSESPTLLTPSESKTLESFDSPTAKTNSNTSSETASFAEEDTADDTTLLLTSLARQLEFYFSPANLPRDTYLQTLQGLNDGYVPVTILASFAKVQALCSSANMQTDPVRIQAAVIKAASQYTTTLTVVSISTVTNKKVNEDTKDATILAVGPREDDVLPVAPKSPIQNTIILRDVPADVTEEDVTSLFEDTSLKSAHLDVANCWFVTLDTTSRDEVMNVMLDLRSKSLKGEPVKARLKGVVSASAVPFVPTPVPYDAPPSPARKQKTKKPKPTTPKKSRRGGKNKNPPDVSAKKVPAPPLIKEDSHFPALADAPVVDNMEKVAAPKPSDAASTATTSSTSSLVSPPQPPAAVVGGYAAALLKLPQATPAAATTTTPTPAASTKAETSENGTSAPTSKKSETTMNGTPPSPKSTVEPEQKQEVPAVPLTWGGGRSFADVLK